MLALESSIIVWRRVASERIEEALHGCFDERELVELFEHGSRVRFAKVRCRNDRIWNGDQDDVKNLQ